MRSVTNPLPESAGYGVGGVYPAVGVDHVLGDVVGVDAVDGVTHVLRGGHHDREGQHAGGGQAVVQPGGWVYYTYVCMT